MKIQNELDQYVMYEPEHRDGLATLIMFNPVSDDMVKKLVREMKCKSCELNLIPTKIIKKHLDKFTPLLSFIINKSLNEACFPDRWKIGVARLKKCILD